MTGNRVAIRYAKALYALANENNLVEDVSADLNLIAATINGNSILQVSLDNPILAESKKLEICIELFSSQISDLVIKFLKFLNEKNRFEILRDACVEFGAIFKEKSGIIDATVFSVIELQKQQRDKIANALSAKTGKNVVLESETDPLLLGGFSIRLGDNVFDSTLKSKLERISKSLKNE